VWALAGAATVLAAASAFADPFFGAGTNVSMLQDDGAKVQLFGRVRSAERGSFVLAVRGMTFHVSAQRREVTSRQDVREGDRVRVFGDMLGGDHIDAEQVQIVERAHVEQPAEALRPSGRMSPHTLTGTVREVDLKGRRMVVAVPAGNLQVDVDEDTNYWRDGAQCHLRDFRVGDTVRVAGKRSAPNAITARKIAYGGPVGWSNGAAGEILSLDKRARELEVDFDGQVCVVKLGSAPIRVDTRRVEMDDLRLDQEVRVFGTARGANTVEASKVEVVTGRPPARSER